MRLRERKPRSNTPIVKWGIGSDGLSTDPKDMITSFNPQKRLAAVEALAANRDTDTLICVATNSPFADTRKNAIEKLHGNIDALVIVAMTSRYEEAVLVVDGLTRNIEALTYIFSYARNKNVSSKVVDTLISMVDELSDEAALRLVFICSRKREVRKKARAKLCSMSIQCNEYLTFKAPIIYGGSAGGGEIRDSNLASTNSRTNTPPQQNPREMIESFDPNIRRAGLQKLIANKDIQALQHVAAHSRFDDIRPEALKGLARNIDALTNVACATHDDEIRRKALDGLVGNTDALLQVVHAHSGELSSSASCDAVERITDRVTLRQLGYHNDSFIGMHARSKLREMGEDTTSLEPF